MGHRLGRGQPMALSSDPGPGAPGHQDHVLGKGSGTALGSARLPASSVEIARPRRRNHGRALKREPPRFMLSFEQEQANQSSTGQLIFGRIDKLVLNDMSTRKQSAVWS